MKRGLFWTRWIGRGLRGINSRRSVSKERERFTIWRKKESKRRRKKREGLLKMNLEASQTPSGKKTP